MPARLGGASGFKSHECDVAVLCLCSSRKKGHATSEAGQLMSLGFVLNA